MQRDLRQRTKTFALSIIKLYTALPRRNDAAILGNQILRSGMSVGAHYREACRAKSNPDFISKNRRRFAGARWNKLLARVARRVCDHANSSCWSLTSWGRRTNRNSCDHCNQGEAQELKASSLGKTV